MFRGTKDVSPKQLQEQLGMGASVRPQAPAAAGKSPPQLQNKYVSCSYSVYIYFCNLNVCVCVCLCVCVCVNSESYLMF